jgi:hypothetical protein
VGILRGDPISHPDFGAPKRTSFANVGPTTYHGYIAIKYKGHQDHRPAGNIIHTSSDLNQMFGVFLGDWPDGFPGGGQNHLVAIENAQGGWAQSHDLIKGSPELRYWLSFRAGDSGGSAWDNGVKITGECWDHGVHLYCQCDDAGIGGHADNDYNDKLVDVFFPLSYGSGYQDVVYEESWGYPIITIVS